VQALHVLLRAIDPNDELSFTPPGPAALLDALAGVRGLMDRQVTAGGWPDGVMTYKVLGWRVPVARLPGWLRGEETHPGERWQVGIEEMRGSRPARVLLRWPANGPEAVSLKLLVDDPETREE
jgi:hypothetical protein